MMKFSFYHCYFSFSVSSLTLRCLPHDTQRHAPYRLGFGVGFTTGEDFQEGDLPHGHHPVSGRRNFEEASAVCSSNCSDTSRLPRQHNSPKSRRIKQNPAGRLGRVGMLGWAGMPPRMLFGVAVQLFWLS